ncbi:MAG: response regulator [Treponema sp.]|jgi:two-component system response regulator YesN|nr:response regulator [Treponema sp.]
MPVILIADDEKNIRAGIRKILSTVFMDSVAYREAKNGEEAFQQITEERIDILITDIRMPHIDGIELMRRIHEDIPNPPVMIVLSGYDEFGYAQKAIAFGAVSYIMKPVDKSELIAEISKHIAKLEVITNRAIEEGCRRIIREGKIYDLPLDISQANPFYFVLVLVKKGTFALPEQSRFGSAQGRYLLEQQTNSILILADAPARQTLENGNFGEPFLMLFSAPCFHVFDLIEGFRQVQTAAFSRFFDNTVSVFHYRKPEHDFDHTRPYTRIHGLIESIRFAEPDAIQESIAGIFSFTGLFPDNRCEYLSFLHECLVLQTVSLYREYVSDNMYLTLKNRMLVNVTCFSSLEEWKKHITDFIIYLNAVLKKKNTRYAFIDEALDWIHRHFTEDINMSVAANHVSVNYTYFSEKFKEHTGCNFNEYLKQLRITTAKKLLEQGFYKVYEVARRSGYRDVKYFLKSFKEITGLSPGEYRRNIRGAADIVNCIAENTGGVR